MDARSLWQTLASLLSGATLPLTQTLLHFLWEGCAIALVYALAMFALRRASANARYLAGVLAFSGMGLCLPITFLLLPGPAPVRTELSAVSVVGAESQGGSRTAVTDAEEVATPVVEKTPGEPLEASAAVPEKPPTPGLGESHWRLFLAEVAPYASGLYLVGAALMLLRVLLGLQVGRHLRAACTSVPDPTILDLVQTHARRLGLRVVPAVAYCQRVTVPVVVGLLRPMILLPLSLLAGLTPQQLEAVLVHELAHIRRYDLAVQVLQRLLEAILFFHPVVWWLSRRISLERENACDDLVLRADCGRLDYAEALIHLAEECLTAQSAGSTALAATGENPSHFKQRVLRLLGQSDAPRVRLTTGGLLVSVALVLAVLLLPVAWRGTAQASDQPDSTATSMSAEAFGRLSLAEQRTVLTRAFQRRLEHAKSLSYEAELLNRAYENQNGSPGKPINETSYSQRSHYWRSGDSYRLDMLDRYRSSLKPEEVMSRSEGVNAAEGVGRSATVWVDGTHPPQGQVQYAYGFGGMNPYFAWLTPTPLKREGGEPPYLFPYLLDHLTACEIVAPVAGDLVRVTVPWSPAWGVPQGGKLVLLLDPRKGFLPVRGDARYDDPPGKKGLGWYEEHFSVEASQLVGEVWMPTELTTTGMAAARPERIGVYRIKILQIESGTVQPGQLFVAFPEGASIQDTIAGATYVTDAQGRPADEVKLAPGWKARPPQGWMLHEGAGGYSMVSQYSPAQRESLDTQAQQREEGFKPIDAALEVIRTSPAGSERQQEAALQILRIYKIGEREREAAWASAIRALIQTGKPAVPKLIEELDRTERNASLRALAFVLRGIGDPRAVPALIRVIPRTLLPTSSDFGLRIEEDAELQRFMEEHGGQKGRGGLFNYGRPLLETVSALEKLTGRSEKWNDLRFVQLDGGPAQQRLQRQLFLELAQRWAEWWRGHWRDFVATEEEAQLDQIQKALEQVSQALESSAPGGLASEFPHGPEVVVSEEEVNWLIRSFVESRSQGCWDLDTRRRPEPPADLVQQSTPDRPSAELLAWAEREGVDLITIQVMPPGSEKPTYAFWPVGLKAWQVEDKFYQNLPKGLEQAADLSQPWEGPLSQRDAKTGAYDEKATFSFLFQTREGTCGALQLKPPLRRKYVEGAVSTEDGGLKYRSIYQRPVEK